MLAAKQSDGGYRKSQWHPRIADNEGQSAQAADQDERPEPQASPRHETRVLVSDWLVLNVFLSFETPACANPCSTRALLPRPSIVDQTSPTGREIDRSCTAPTSQCHCFPLHSLAASAIHFRCFLLFLAPTFCRYILSTSCHSFSASMKYFTTSGAVSYTHL